MFPLYVHIDDESEYLHKCEHDNGCINSNGT